MNFDFSDLAGKDVVFVGMGKGRSMADFESFLKQHADIKSFSGVHRQPEATQPYGFLEDHDPTTTVFIKNEAVPPQMLPVPYITPWQLFFRLAHDNHITVVGITGTKGKSTTTSLTAARLQRAGKKVALAGNLGLAPWDALNQATTDTIFVLELSSYQLSDIYVSPHISACINLYNDHTDWHGSLENYWEAKHNIVRYAEPDDIFIYNPDFAELRTWAEDADCHTIAIDPSETIDFVERQAIWRPQHS